MPKKPTKVNIKAAAELTIAHEGGVDEAISNYVTAKGLAQDKGDEASVETFNRLIAYCQNR